MKPHIRIQGLSKAYPESITEADEVIRHYLADDTARQAAGVSFALRDISFEVADGERIGLIGANGAGKTTLMRILTGLAMPSTGRVEVEGKLQAILTIGASLREDMTGRENLLLAARLAGHPEERLPAVTEDMIDFAGLDHFIDWPVRTYSSGMKARLSFAGAIFIDPEILLIDEALSVGDRTFADKATAAVRKLCEAGRIVMIVSHSVETITAMCDRCIWLDNGRLVMDGPAKEVGEAYEQAMRLKFERAMISSSQSRNATLDSRIVAMSDLAIDMKQAPATDAMPMPSPMLTLSCDLTLAASVASLDVELQVERLDGLLIARNRTTLPGPHEPGEITIEIDAPEFFLASGFYMIGLGISADGALLAQLGGQIQIQSEIVYKHGTPTLAWPMFLSTSPG
ncbi:ABC transporter ATP-binding protein [Bosea robiniae]|uniref:Lipopolysaccharide transport system ATP-binding protein n=1 Tax=Bosea robiniae TaxID=1036780 RepID=A0ABY0P2Y6_9HYPH|nr:ATP-binding cassette domain-containing protein [Bosea robiniae]SDG79096.1 lipopolysaccharide transport system ATP-binding protein [Bosea robiniae]